MPNVHLVAHTRTGSGSLLVPSHARRVFASLRTAFAGALAVVLMPTHLHLVLWIQSVELALQQLQRQLASVGRHSGLAWESTDEPEILRDTLQLRRNLRYVWLNPTRKGLAADPLEWLWSTYRDWHGAAADPWVTPWRLSEAVGDSSPNFVERFHRYCSSDRSVSENGTPVPRASEPCQLATVGLEKIAIAAAAATRQPVDAVRRKGITRSTFLELAALQGWRDTAQLAAVCEITPRAVRKQRLPVGAQTLHAASLCLGDSRLTVGIPGNLRTSR